MRYEGKTAASKAREQREADVNHHDGDDRPQDDVDDLTDDRNTKLPQHPRNDQPENGDDRADDDEIDQ